MKEQEKPKMPLEMTANEAASFAYHTVLDKNFQKVGGKMLYCALVKDELCPKVLYVLALYMAKFFTAEPALALCELALSKFPPGDIFARILEDERRRIVEDSASIEPFLDPRITPPYDPSNIHRFVIACRTFIGHRSQALEHRITGGADLLERFEEYNHPENFQETEVYKKFLKSTEGHSDDFIEGVTKRRSIRDE